MGVFRLLCRRRFEQIRIGREGQEDGFEVRQDGGEEESPDLVQPREEFLVVEALELVSEGEHADGDELGVVLGEVEEGVRG